MIENRHNHILRKIDKEGLVTIVELASDLKVSEMTIRRDLKILEDQNLLKRIHGGASSASGRSYEPPLIIRSEFEKEAKVNIGKCASSFVENGDSIAIDIGSTTYEVAKNLTMKRNLTVITPGLYIANLFFDRPDIKTILPGGIVRHGEGSLTGHLTELAFNGLFVDKLFLGLGGISSQAGCTEYNWEDSLVKQAMVKSAKEVIAVVDATKFEKIVFAQVCGLSSLKKIITNKTPPDNLFLALREAQVEIVVA